MPLAQPLATQGIELLLQSGLDALAAPHDAAAPEPAGAPAVVMFRPETPLREALQTLSKHRLLSAPVLCATSDACAADEGAFEGFCDVAAILHHVLSALDPTLLEEDGATTTDDIVRVMDALTALAPDALEAPVSAVSRNDGDLIYRGYESCSLLDIITAGFVHPFHLRDVAICHRLAAADVRPELDAATSLSDVSARSMSIISHMDLIKFLHRRVDELGPLADASVQALGLAAPNMFVFAVPGSEPAVCVLLELDEHKLSAAGVVNSDGELVANLSVSDLRDVPADQFGLLALPVLEFLSVRASCRKPRSAVTVTMDSTLRDVLRTMVSEEVHHVYVLPPSGVTPRQPQAVITPTDVLFLFDTPPPSETHPAGVALGGKPGMPHSTA